VIISEVLEASVLEKIEAFVVLASAFSGACRKLRSDEITSSFL